MSLASLQRFFDTSPAMHLLRSPHAAWITHFLWEQFKQAGQITRSHSALVSELEICLNSWLRNASAVTGLRRERSTSGTAESYLASWCSAEYGWLKRFIDDDHSEPLYQLTAETELVLNFVTEASRPSGPIGTHAHLRSILRLLSEAVAEAEAHVSSTAPQSDSGLAREQLALAVRQLNQLTSQFRAIEEHFKGIVRGVQHRLLGTNDSRADILQYALDAEDELKRGEQGRSFFEFLRLVHEPASQAQIAELIQRATRLAAVADRGEDLHTLRGMVPLLLAEAEKILRTTQHLSQALRRLLDSQVAEHQQQLSRVLRDIRSLATSLAEAPPAHLGLEIEAELQIQAPFDRQFWAQTEAFEQVELQLIDSDPLERSRILEQLLTLERIDWQSLRKNIAQQLQQHAQVSLSDLLQQHPIRAGVVEVLAYLQIAYEDGHSIDTGQAVELWTEGTNGVPRKLQMPQVIFGRRRPRVKHATQSAPDSPSAPTQAESAQ